MILPPAYTRCDYLQTVGCASNIDTGVEGNDDTIEIDFGIEVLSKGNYSPIFGNNDGEDKTCWRLIQSTTNNVDRFHFTLNDKKAGASPAVVITGIDTIVNKKFRVHMEYGDGYIEYNNIKYYVNSHITDSSEKSTNTIYIGKNGPDYGNNASLPSNRFHDFFKIKKQGKLVRYYIPCIRKSDSKAGFYDLINHTFNPSIGSVDFVAGNDNS